jgi:hypothetical protein
VLITAPPAGPDITEKGTADPREREDLPQPHVTNEKEGGARMTSADLLLPTVDVLLGRPEAGTDS